MVTSIKKYEFVNGTARKWRPTNLQQMNQNSFSCIADYKWDIKWIFIDWTSPNRGPLQIPLC